MTLGWHPHFGHLVIESFRVGKEDGMSRTGFSIATVLAAALSVVQGQEPRRFGAGVTLTETTPLSRVVDRPEDFEGKTVRVEGIVTAVCMHMGCWMALATDASDGRTMLVKVDDGVIVFPSDAKSRRAVAQGVVERIQTGNREQQEASAEYARSGAATRAPLWQLKATGAVVFE
jgi:hypothetical protein